MEQENTPSNTFFPTARSLFSVEVLGKLLETEYGLSHVRCQLIKAMICDTYRVTTMSASYILRIYRYNWRTIAQINSKMDFIDYLASKGMSVAEAVIRKNGDRLLPLNAIEGKRYAVLFTYVEGNILGDDIQTANRYGCAIAQVHFFGDTFSTELARPDIDSHLLLDQPLEALDIVLAHRLGDIRYLHRISDMLKARLAPLSMKKPEYGLCHGDVDSSNALVSADGQITLLDFDFCGSGWRAFDIGCYFADKQFGNESQDLSQAFLAGYQEIRSLEEAEMMTIALFQAARTVWSLGIFAININEWGSFRLSDRFIKQMLDNIRALEKQIEIGFVTQ
jgi:Ser/Thr protein kinase RdoA (MazF antagonist)